MGGQTTVIGLAIVFAVLIILMIVLSLFKVIFYKKPKTQAAPAAVPAIRHRVTRPLHRAKVQHGQRHRGQQHGPKHNDNRRLPAHKVVQTQLDQPSGIPMLL